MLATRHATLTALYWAAVTYTALGLVSGVYYRELTKYQGFTGDTQLSTLHTHFFALGLLVMLTLLALEKLFTLSADSRFKAFFVIYNGALALTTALMAIKGTMQVLRPDDADSAALAGVAGLGHIGLTLGLVVLLMVLKRRVVDSEH